MQLGAVFSHGEVGGDVAAMRDYAQAVQDLGYDFVVVSDHVVGADPAAYPELPRVFPIESRVHEPLTLFAFFAGVAPRLGYLSSVVILPQRQTALVAKQAAEIDIVSDGRLRLGVGIGWNPVEFTALGMDFRNRARRFEEQIEVMRLLWTQPVVTFAGRYQTLKAVGINPLPVQRPIPIWIGASAEAAVKRACAIGDGYLPLAPLAGGWQATMDKIHEWLREAGRDPSTFGIEGRLNATNGTPDAWREQIEMWRGFGASHLSVSTQGLGGVEPQVRRLLTTRQDRLGAMVRPSRSCQTRRDRVYSSASGVKRSATTGTVGVPSRARRAAGSAARRRSSTPTPDETSAKPRELGRVRESRGGDRAEREETA